MTQPTKGEWMAVGAWVEHTDFNTPDIASFDPAALGQTGRSYDEQCANARLCAAAKELRAALRRSLPIIEEHAPGSLTLAMAHLALGKAGDE